MMGIKRSLANKRSIIRCIGAGIGPTKTERIVSAYQVRNRELVVAKVCESPAVLNPLPSSNFGHPEMHPPRVPKALVLGRATRSASHRDYKGIADHD
jgi:hypothetical protein